MNLIEPKFKLLVYDKKQFKDKDEANNNIALIKIEYWIIQKNVLLKK